MIGSGSSSFVGTPLKVLMNVRTCLLQGKVAIEYYGTRGTYIASEAEYGDSH